MGQFYLMAGVILVPIVYICCDTTYAKLVGRDANNSVLSITVERRSVASPLPLARTQTLILSSATTTLPRSLLL